MGNNIVRNSSVELLRFFFMYMIVIGHIYVHGTGIDYHLIYSWGNEWTTAPHLSLFALSKVGVTGFMFISGYYGIRMNKAKWANLLLVALFYYVVLMRGHGWQGALHPYDLWWYLSAYVVICLLAPFIESGIQSLGEKKVRYAVIGLLKQNVLVENSSILRNCYIGYKPNYVPVEIFGSKIWDCFLCEFFSRCRK